MKKEELKLGNFIQRIALNGMKLPDDIKDIVEVDEQLVNDEWLNIDDYKYIEIDEDLLMLIGFNEYENIDYDFHLSGGMFLKKIENGWSVLSRGLTEIRIDPILYLHELQNVYEEYINTNGNLPLKINISLLFNHYRKLP